MGATIERTKHYDGRVILEHKPNGRPRYRIQDLDVSEDWKVLPGVTTALGIMDKPNLLQWAANEAAKHYRDSGPGDHYDDARYAWRTKRDKSADLGTIAHDQISEILSGNEPTIDPATEKIMKAFDGFMNALKPEVIATEQPVVSRSMGYGGKFDFECMIDGKLYMGDFKTGDPDKEFKNNKYTGKYRARTEHMMQNAAYAMARSEEYPEKIYHGFIVAYVTKSGKFMYFVTDKVKHYTEAWKVCLYLSRAKGQLDNEINQYERPQ